MMICRGTSGVSNNDSTKRCCMKSACCMAAWRMNARKFVTRSNYSTKPCGGSIATRHLHAAGAKRYI